MKNEPWTPSGKSLKLTKRDVPLTVIFEGDNGEREAYQIVAGSRKFGLCMQKITENLKRLLLPRS